MYKNGDFMCFCENFKKLLDDRKMTCYRLHVITKIPMPTLYNYYHNLATPSCKYLTVICDAFQCSLEYLLKGTNNENKDKIFLSEDEKELLFNFRGLEDDKKTSILKIIKYI